MRKTSLAWSMKGKGLGVTMALAVALCAGAPAPAQQVPHYAPDYAWPQKLPNDWMIGQVGGITSDADGNVWILQRPLSLNDDEKAASLTPPRGACCKPAPPVMQFDRSGKLLRAWGGPSPDYPWVSVPHGIDVDAQGNVWITGNGPEDGVVLKFTQDGKFLGKIGSQGPSLGSGDTTRLGRPAQTTVDTAANEVYVADGYGNHRVIVYDATSFAFKRMWGAYGRKPHDPKDAAYDPHASVDAYFRNPVHCVKISHDGLVYVCDRENNRVQIFRKDGSFVREWLFNRDTLGAGAVWDLVFWPDAKQSLVLIADGQNNIVRIVDRRDGRVVSEFGHQGRSSGYFFQVHDMTIDQDGNVYTGEVADMKRAQKFTPDISPAR